MKKNIFFVIIGFALGASLSSAWAVYESGSGDAAPVVGYGYNGNSLVAIKVDSSGVLQTN